jgi:hypothetical protein
MGIAETAFRTNAQGLNTANAYNSSFRRFPIKWSGSIAPQPLRYKMTKQRSAGKGLDYSNIYRDGYEDCRFTISGEVLDFAFLKQLCGANTYAGGSPNTHTYVSSTTPATPTFQMLQRIKNVSTWTAAKLGYTNDVIAMGQGATEVQMTADSTVALNALAGKICTINGVEYRIVSNEASVTNANKVHIVLDHACGGSDNGQYLYLSESKYILYVGCKITDFVCSYAEATGRITGSLTIECAYTMGGTPLSSEPAWITDPPYYFNPSSGLDFKVATVTQVGYCAAWTFHYNNGQSLRKPNYLLTPDMVISNFRTPEWDFTWVTEVLDDFNNSQGDPRTDQDINIAWTLSGGDGSDTFVATFVKAVLEHLGEAYEYKEFYLARKYKITLNPALTSTLTLVESNSADATYY